MRRQTRSVFVGLAFILLGFLIGISLREDRYVLNKVSRSTLGMNDCEGSSSVIKPKVEPEEHTFKNKGKDPVRTDTISGTNLNRRPSCQKIFARDFRELVYAEDYMQANPQKPLSESYYVMKTKNCADFRKSRGYPDVPRTELEAQFPIAYVIVVYTDIQQLERMLRLIYTPQNYYCIHVDLKSSKEYFEAVESLTKCFDNVILSSVRYDVVWGRWTQMDANMQCMKDFLTAKYWKKWKYLINLTGHEFPMKNNYELVQILRAYNGSNDFAGTKEEGRHNLARIRTNKRKLPYDLQYVKGEIHGVFSKNFVHYLFNSPIALSVTNFLANRSVHADESLFNTLHYNAESQAPGGYLGEDKYAKTHWMRFWPVRYKHWMSVNSIATMPYTAYGCRHSIDHGICRYGIEDLKYIRKYARKALFMFINKIRKTDYLVFDCLEEDFLQHEQDIEKKHLTFNLAAVANLAVVKYGRHNGIDDSYPQT